MRTLLCTALLLSLSFSAQAVSFKNVAEGVWSTGLSNGAALLTAPSADSHYVLIQPTGCTVPSPPANCSGFGPNAVLVVGPPTNGSWPSGNGSESQWIGPVEQQGSVGNNGIFNSTVDYYVYRLIFNLSNLGLMADTAQISLRWLADNDTGNVGNPTTSSHIRICSIPDAGNRDVCAANTAVANSSPGAQNMGSFSSQPTITLGSSLFAAGYMALDFVVYNSPIAFGENPSGLRLEIVAATADPNPVPEPITLSMMGLGLIGLGMVARRK